MTRGGSQLDRLAAPSGAPDLLAGAAARGAVDTLMRTVRTHHPKADLGLIERAYTVAERAHAGQKRQSGEPYITHPLAVAQILADLGIGSKTIAAALLHDTVEDTAYTLDQLRADFGDEVAMLVDGVTKLDKVKYGDSAQAETVRKMIVAMSKDIRVLIIKLADRLHNARTWGFVPGRVRGAQGDRDARDLRAARASPRHPGDQVGARGPLVRRALPEALRRDREPREAAHPAARGVRAERHRPRRRGPARLRRSAARSSGRPKQYYSIYQKMVVRGRDFDEIYDLVGIRVLVELGARLLRGARRDPRALDAAARSLQGLHRDPEVQPLPVAAHDGDRPEGPRGRDPDPHARDAPARRVRRRGALEVQGADGDGGKRRHVRSNDTDMAWLAHISDWQAETADPGEFLDSLRFEIGAKEVYVFTPKGRVIGLPAGRDPGRLRLRRAHRGRPPHDGREGQRPARAARERADERRRRRGVHLEEPGLRAEPGLARTSSRARAPATRSGSGSPRSAATRRSSRARTRSPARCASRTCRCRS